VPAYLLANIDVTDPEGYKAYSAEVGPLIAAHGGRVLIRAGACDVVEGDWQPRRVVLIEFPSLDAARAFYHSPEYAPVKQIRLDNSTAEVTLIDGVAPS